MLRFSVKKYKEWRMNREGIDEATLDLILEFSGYDKLDGETYDKMWKDGRLVLKDWCVDDETE